MTRDAEGKKADNIRQSKPLDAWLKALIRGWMDKEAKAHSTTVLSLEPFGAPSAVRLDPANRVSIACSNFARQGDPRLEEKEKVMMTDAIPAAHLVNNLDSDKPLSFEVAVKFGKKQTLNRSATLELALSDALSLSATVGKEGVLQLGGGVTFSEAVTKGVSVSQGTETSHEEAVTYKIIVPPRTKIRCTAVPYSIPTYQKGTIDLRLSGTVYCKFKDKLNFSQGQFSKKFGHNVVGDKKHQVPITDIFRALKAAGKLTQYGIDIEGQGVLFKGLAVIRKIMTYQVDQEKTVVEQQGSGPQSVPTVEKSTLALNPRFVYNPKFSATGVDASLPVDALVNNVVDMAQYKTLLDKLFAPMNDPFLCKELRETGQERLAQVLAAAPKPSEHRDREVVAGGEVKMTYKKIDLTPKSPAKTAPQASLFNDTGDQKPPAAGSSQAKFAPLIVNITTLLKTQLDASSMAALGAKLATLLDAHAQSGFFAGLKKKDRKALAAHLVQELPDYFQLLVQGNSVDSVVKEELDEWYGQQAQAQPTASLVSPGKK